MAQCQYLFSSRLPTGERCGSLAEDGLCKIHKIYQHLTIDRPNPNPNPEDPIEEKELDMGPKGNLGNIAQLFGKIGQQYYSGQRLPPAYNF